MQEILLAFTAVMLYGAVHSVLAALGVKAWFLERLGKRAYLGLYTLVFNVVATVTLLPVVWLVVGQPGETLWRVEGAGRAVLLGTQVLGLLGLAISLLQIDGMRFLGIRQALAWLNGDVLPLPPEPLQTGGVYALVRHPLYLFSLMVIWPMATLTAAWLGFNLGVTLYFIIGSRLEEQKLRRTFGDTYEIYRAQVPWLIPFVKFG